jgi:hypothetical protein
MSRALLLLIGGLTETHATVQLGLPQLLNVKEELLLLVQITATTKILVWQKTVIGAQQAKPSA